MHSRCSTKRALLCVGPDGRECISDHGNKQVDEPEIQDDDGEDEKYGGDKELAINDGVHQMSPLPVISSVTSQTYAQLTPLTEAMTMTCKAAK